MSAIATARITEDTLVPFYTINNQMFATLHEACGRMIPAFHKGLKDLGAFGIEVNGHGSRLQNQQIAIPPLHEMVELRSVIVKGYWEYKNIYQKATKMAQDLEKAIQYLKPAPRAYTEEQDFKRNAPELFTQMESSEKIACKNIETLSNHLGMVTSIHTKMVEAFNNPVDWSVQRYVQIVQNLGVPLGILTRGWNNAAYHVPTCEELAQQDSLLKVAHPEAFKSSEVKNEEIKELLSSKLMTPTSAIPESPQESSEEPSQKPLPTESSDTNTTEQVTGTGTLDMSNQTETQ